MTRTKDSKKLKDLMEQLLERFGKRLRTDRDRSDFPDLFDGIPDPSDDNSNPASGIDDNEQRLLRILQFCLLVGMGYFILGNVRPYIDFTDSLLFQWQDTEIFQFLLKLPILGWFLGGGFALVGFAIGTILWAILQLAELLPTFLNDSPNLILQILARIKSWQKLDIKKKDSKIAAQLKQRYNAIPESTIEKANLARAVAYLLDGVICLNFYTPIEGGWENLGLMLTTNDWSYFRADQFGYIIVTLFAVEVLYWAYKLVTGIAEMYFENN
jgi:hypothetical protein